MLIDTYVIRLYCHENKATDSDEYICVVEAASQDMKQYVTRLEELPDFLNQIIQQNHPQLP
jgi:hypothetical protein